MKTMYDVRNILKRFGVFIYTGNRLADLEMIADELKELYEHNLITPSTYQHARLIVMQEKRNIVNER